MDTYELDANMNYPKAFDFMEKYTTFSCVTDLSSLKSYYNNKIC